MLMQDGLHPDFNIEWYEDLLRTLHAKYPTFQLHCFSPPEIHNISLISWLDYVTIMQRLKDAGLNSMPGGGGEILDDEVRKRVSTKCTTQEWLDVMRAAHQVGLRTTGTMMFGIGDRVEHRVRHLQRIRDLQDECFFYVWNEELSEVRLMCSFDTQEQDILGFTAKIKSLLSEANV